MTKHLLDRPAWNALSTRQAHVAIGNEFAKRFLPEIGPLAASRDDSTESLAALSELVQRIGRLVLLQVDDVVLPPHVDVTMAAPGVQMIATNPVPSFKEFSNRIERLTDEDIPAMVALATLTKPGPFETGTPRLGEFLGIKEEGRLVAMAGERMKQIGYTEVSGVCAHPSARGRGYARALSAAVATRIIERGETPYLHAYASNTAAIRLYQTLGFTLRRPVYITALEIPGSGGDSQP